MHRGDGGGRRYERPELTYRAHVHIWDSRIEDYICVRDLTPEELRIIKAQR
jgi:hypothetical protein